MTYNKTQLNPDTTFERHVYHRDQFAHYLRWTHVLKKADIGMNILDVGCGSGNLAEVFYRNRFKPNFYLGLDVRPQTIKQCQEKFKDVPWSRFEVRDIVKENLANQPDSWDLICCFEVFEHIGKSNGIHLMQRIYNQCDDETTVLLSTPCYDEKVGAADNHMIDGEVGEFTYNEFKTLVLNQGFMIKNHWGTFASVRDYKEKVMDSPFKEFYLAAKEYFDPNILSNLMAPLFPEQSRNVLWEVTL